jgi:hypothetical protein
LEDDFQPPPADGSSQQLIAVVIGLVAPYFKVGEETLNRFHKSNAVSGKLVSLKVVFKVTRFEAMPVYQGICHLLSSPNLCCHQLSTVSMGGAPRLVKP